MESRNFEFLRDRWPELSSLGGFAEQYVWPDPSSALVKLRTYVESMVHRFYGEHGLPAPPSDSLIELLNAFEFKQSVPSVVLNALHSIRLPDRYPKQLPVLFCNDPKLPIGVIDRHILSDGSACLGVYTDLMIRWSMKSDIANFLDNFVAP